MPERESQQGSEGFRFPTSLPEELQVGRARAFAYLGEDREDCAGIYEIGPEHFVVFHYSRRGGVETSPTTRRSTAYRAFGNLVESDTA